MFIWLDHLITKFVEGTLGLSVATQLGSSVHFFFYDGIKILILLSFMIFTISYLRSYFQLQKTKAMLEHIHGPKAHIAVSLLGIITPFYSCSSGPIFIGFVEAGIPLGVTFSFPITSPIVNEEALVGKREGLGTTLAFMMAVPALSVPEMVLLQKVMKPRLIACFVFTATIGILLVVWMFNWVF